MDGVLVWINGPFGGGRTQTAYHLRRRLPGAVVCDPEEVGFGLHRMTPRRLRGDFQDHPAWRQGVVEVLDHVLTHHDGPVIAPMTVVDRGHFAETVGRLRALGHPVHHVALLATRETVLRRLSERVHGPTLAALLGRDRALRRESFAVAALDRCLDALAHPDFAVHLHTDDLTTAQVAEHTAHGAGLRLSPDPDGPLRAWGRRTWTGLRHIRLR
ncbi:putative TmrB-like protein [Actinokineospora spheciospongiae]|uniref:Putative TmrB-like protein n=1 Tax=Actinokineospora spheciospongiae TaxID=909613 RepID=W7IG70_9PSEU|nr:putative TmrB-like protein [Actinokineospora spheciospongiae]